MDVSVKKLIECFYNQLWNNQNEDLASEILSVDFCFRGSLGFEKHGQQGFVEYMRSIHAALADYHCAIEELIIESNHAAARMKFSGKHKDTFLNFPATGRIVQWSGAAFFEIQNNRIQKLWVLGDVDSIKIQLSH